MTATYTYDPANIGEDGSDRMRFELGDTMVEGGAATCALADEEYRAVLARFPGRWKRAKLALVESILRRFSYEVDLEVDALSLSLQERVKHWQALYQQLKAETAGCPGPIGGGGRGGPYFWAGMHDNRRDGGTEGGGGHVF